MSATPDPQTVRKIAREVLLETVAGRDSNFDNSHTGSALWRELRTREGLLYEKFSAWFDAVKSAIGEATVTVSWPDEQPTAAQDERDARITQLECELLALRGTEMNPSEMVLDAQSYDELAAAMGDEWDGEDSESYILVQYVRWLVAGQPRDEDGYPIRRETYPAPGAEQDGDDVETAISALRAAADDPTRCRNQNGLHVCIRKPHKAGDHLDAHGWSWESAELDAREAKAEGA